MTKRRLRRLKAKRLTHAPFKRGWVLAHVRQRGSWCRLVRTLMDCGALMTELRRREELQRLDEMEVRAAEMSRALEPGDQVVMRGRALWSMGCVASELAREVWTVVPCSCDLCQLGRHVVITPPERHIARAAIRRVDELVIDELRAVDSDALTAAIGRGIVRRFREGTR
jgi:hypothetical protein